MESTFEKRVLRLAVFSLGAIFIANVASPAHPGLANAQQQNKTFMQLPGMQNTW